MKAADEEGRDEGGGWNAICTIFNWIEANARLLQDRARCSICLSVCLVVWTIIPRRWRNPWSFSQWVGLTEAECNAKIFNLLRLYLRLTWLNQTEWIPLDAVDPTRFLRSPPLHSAIRSTTDAVSQQPNPPTQ